MYIITKERTTPMEAMEHTHNHTLCNHLSTCTCIYKGQKDLFIQTFHVHGPMGVGYYREKNTEEYTCTVEPHLTDTPQRRTPTIRRTSMVPAAT